jgi:hypothetical protein
MRWRADQVLGWINRQAPLGIRQWTSDMGAGLRGAQRELAKAIAEGRVQAWGRPTPNALFERIPSDPFRIKGRPLVVDPYGEMTPLLPHKPYPCDNDDPIWHAIEFEADEIRRAWPKRPSPSVEDWMLEDAERSHAAGRVGKRDDMVRRCMAATSCTKREAEAAHKKLRPELRRPRGKPPKVSG